ncbi:MAG: 5,10-methylenetetrahydromethanopterin reductase [Conexibacter sp.]|nr:5,10-methylenetetrahydromethanopterin reductase [Conexibacter sp.]
MSSNVTSGSPLGLLISSQVAPEQIPELAQLAEREGFGELWIPEDYFFYGGVSGALTALNATSEIKVGLGVVSAMARHPAALAMELATIDRLHPGRIWPGIGLGVPHWVQQMGLLPKSPLTALRETVTNVRKLLAGEEVTFEGKIHSFDKVQLVHPAITQPPIYMGVIGPKMLNLAGEVADATVVSVLAGTKYLGWLRERVAEGQAKAGREGENHRVSTFALYAVDADSAKAKAEARAVTAFYLAAVPKSALTDVYGIGDELWDMYQRGGENAAELIAREMPDQWIEDLVIAGDPDEVAAKIQALIDAGSDSVALAPVAADRPAEIATLTAREVLPKVTARTVSA